MEGVRFNRWKFYECLGNIGSDNKCSFLWERAYIGNNPQKGD